MIGTCPTASLTVDASTFTAHHDVQRCRGRLAQHVNSGKRIENSRNTNCPYNADSSQDVDA
jgi:hypothetical protein